MFACQAETSIPRTRPCALASATEANITPAHSSAIPVAFPFPGKTTASDLRQTGFMLIPYYGISRASEQLKPSEVRQAGGKAGSNGNQSFHCECSRFCYTA